MSAFTSGRPEPRPWPKLRTSLRPGLTWGIAGGQEKILESCPWERRRLSLVGNLMMVTSGISGLSVYALTSILRGSFHPVFANCGLAVAAWIIVFTVDRSLVFPTVGNDRLVAKTILRIGLAAGSALVIATILVSAIFSSGAVRKLDQQFEASNVKQLSIAKAKLRSDTEAATVAVAPQVSSVQTAMKQLESQDEATQNQAVSAQQVCQTETLSGDPTANRPAGYGPVATQLCAQAGADESAAEALATRNNPVISADQRTLAALQAPVSSTDAADEKEIKSLSSARPPKESELGFWTIVSAVDHTVPMYWLIGFGLILFLDLAPILVVASWGKTDYHLTLERGSASFTREIDEEDKQERRIYEARARTGDDTYVEISEVPPVAALHVLRPLADASTAHWSEELDPEASNVVGIVEEPTVVAGPRASDLAVARRELRLGHVLGRGAYFEVRHAEFTSMSGDEKVRYPLGLAAKLIRPEFAGHHQARAMLEREIQFYSECGYLDYIPRLRLWESPGPRSDGCLLLEYFPLGTLAQWGSWASQDLTAEVLAAMMLNLIDAEAGLWRGMRSQSDIKPHNIGICGRPGDRLFEFAWPYIARAPGALVLFDFNGVSPLGQSPTSRSGAYTPPELRFDALRQGVLSVESDLWAIAATVWSMATLGRRPPIGRFEDTASVPAAKEMNPLCPAALSDLLARFFHPDPAARLGLEPGIDSWDTRSRALAIRQAIHASYQEMATRGENSQVVWPAGELAQTGESNIDVPAASGVGTTPWETSEGQTAIDFESEPVVKV